MWIAKNKIKYVKFDLNAKKSNFGCIFSRKKIELKKMDVVKRKFLIWVI